MENASPPPTSPPAIPGSVEPLKWPKVIGIISIVFAIFSLFGGVSSLFTTKMLRFQMKLSQENGGNLEAFEAYLAKWNWYFVMGGVLGLIIGVLLLIGGIGLLRFKKSSIGLMRGYAVVTIVYSGVLVYMSLASPMIDEQMRAMLGIAEGESLDQYPEAKIGKISGMVSGIVSAIFSMVYPAFLLIWFNRRKIRRDVETGFGV